MERHIGKIHLYNTAKEDLAKGAAIWAKTSARLRGVQVQNCTPLCLKENGPPSWGISTFTSLEINKVSPTSMFTAFQTSES